MKKLDNHVFSEKETTWRDRSRVRFPTSIRGDVAQVKWISAYITEILRSEASWFILVDDKSFIVAENLLPLLSEISIEKPAYSLIENVRL
jgi:S-adenosylmethionine:diacylglycerol 3-amino-3-carboxypropyl transferase